MGNAGMQPGGKHTVDRPSAGSTQPPHRRAAWLCLVYTSVLTAVLLAPFEFYAPRHREDNGVRWLDEAPGVQLTSNGIIVSAGPARKLHEALADSSELTIEAWLQPAHVGQRGPARIVTYSFDTHRRNFTLGQQGTELVLRLRTSETDLDGSRPETIVPDVFTVPRLMHLVVTADGPSRSVYVDGRLVARVAGPGGTFANWDPGYRLALGNELTGQRPWRGRLFQVAIDGRAWTSDEVARRSGADPTLPAASRGGGSSPEDPLLLYTFDEREGRLVRERDAGPDALDLTIPEWLVVSQEHFLSPPYRDIELRYLTLKQLGDLVANLLLFVPVGLLGYRWLQTALGGRLSAAVVVVAAALLLTLGVEITQYFVRGRESSLGDVLHNFLGTLIGVALASRR